MTRSPHNPPLRFSDADELASILRERGHRLSAARRLVLDALFKADGPVAAEYIAEGAGGRVARSDVTSVYRNLTALEELGVVRHVHIGHGPGLYGLVSRGEREYLACERCDRVRSVDPSELEPVRDLLRDRFGYEARFSHFPILGLCPDCAARERDPDLAAGRRRGPGGEREHSHGDYIHSHRRVPGGAPGSGHRHGH
jgi:Fur family transcriptional regulator, ferric uptake regulator